MHLCTQGSLILIEPFTQPLHDPFFGIRYFPKVWCLLWPRSYPCIENFFKTLKIYFPIFTWEVFNAKTKFCFVRYRDSVRQPCPIVSCSSITDRVLVTYLTIEMTQRSLSEY